jgi:hypothetical protein
MSNTDLELELDEAYNNTEEINEREVTDTPSYRFASSVIAGHPKRKKFRISQDGNTSYLGHKDNESEYVQIDHKGGKIHWQHASGATGSKINVHTPEKAKQENGEN